ncbi:MAG: aldo/keto reductase [Anaerolineae bacterium]|jgi:D-threo-aldose 1-dehydrogenase|nr:aldo/keto reductase [Anaerolineae bacterium]
MKIGFGSAALANGPAWDWTGSISATQAVETVLHAHARGIRLFDTAPSYGGGLVEERLGRALAQLPRQQFIIATKAGYTRDAGGIHYDYSRDGIRRSVEGSLKRLQLERVDIVHIHDPDHHMQQALQEAYPALALLREQGVIGKISAGMNQWQGLLDLARHADFDCLMIAGRYTLLEQGALPLLAYCAEQGIPVLAAAIYNSGILATGAEAARACYNHAPAPAAIRERVRQIEAICRSYQVPLHTAATRFPLLHPAVTHAVVGFQSPAEIDACLDALTTPIDPALWQHLVHSDLLHPLTTLPVTKMVSS